MLSLTRRCKFHTCRYYGNVTNKVKFESWLPLLLNLNREFPFVPCKLFSSKTNLSPTNANVEWYLNHLTNAYKNNDQENESIVEILKLQTVTELLNEKLKITENLKNLEELVDNDKELKSLAMEEKSVYEKHLLDIDERILDTIVENLGEESYENIVVEIVPGVGGQEAMFFVKDLLTMYEGYLNYLGLDYEIIESDNSEQGGLRNVTMVISSEKAFKNLKYESGVHRVQRIPTTEKSGRMHTSTAVVQVLPEPKDIEINLNDKDLKIEAKRASGAGGQHVNTTSSAVRVVHIPTGTIVTCQIDRSQIKNKKWALLKLRSILYQQEVSKQTSFIATLRKKQMGMRSRNEKIRTYNYNQDRITDHRIANGTLHDLKEFMKGGPMLEELQDRLRRDMQQKLLLEIIQKMENELK
ncbi:mitochondrial translation release factor 1 [Colletes latitarsis]|uniref:mitochondrial translation release factor 1 n=1 Tax=Colletes latitarsis TaxID=2605962 RepID=UPI004035FDAF